MIFYSDKVGATARVHSLEVHEVIRLLGYILQKIVSELILNNLL